MYPRLLLPRRVIYRLALNDERARARGRAKYRGLSSAAYFKRNNIASDIKRRPDRYRALCSLALVVK